MLSASGCIAFVSGLQGPAGIVSMTTPGVQRVVSGAKPKMEVHVAVLMRREHEDGTNDVGGDRDTDQVSQDVKSIAYHGKDDEKSGGRASVTVEYHDGNVGPKPYYFDNIFTEEATLEHIYTDSMPIMR